MEIIYPDGTQSDVKSEELAKIAAAVFFARFKDDLEKFETQWIDIFCIDDKKSQQAFMAKLHADMLCMISVGVFNGICGPGSEDSSEKVKLLFNDIFDKVSKLLEIFYPTIKFMAYSIEKDDKGGKPKDGPKI